MPASPRKASAQDAYVNDINDDSHDLDGLPSYEDVIREEQGQRPPPPRPPQRPPQRPPRPGSSANGSSISVPTHHSHSHPQSQNHPHNSASSPPSASASSRPPQSNALPWVYPRNFRCPKCNNTGYKLKNGKSCKSCWRKFAPANSVHSVPTAGYYNSNSNSNYYYYPQGGSLISPSYSTGPATPWGSRPQSGAAAAPLMVRPGDPRIGGVLCGACRGSGRTRFLLDEDICTVCNGLGRIVR